jgi:hypothetical protein
VAQFLSGQLLDDTYLGKRRPADTGPIILAVIEGSGGLPADLTRSETQ